MSGSAFPVVVAVALAAAAALAVPPAPTLPGRPAVRAAASEGGPGGGLVRRWRPVLAAVAALLGPLVVGGPAGWVVACVVGLVVWRLAGAESEAEVRARAAAARDLPHLVALLGDAVRSGSDPWQALGLVADVVPGPAAEPLRLAAARWRLGAGPDELCRALVADPAVAPLGRALERAGESGSSVVEAIDALAADLADARRAALEERARSVGVRAAVPLGVCLLPAFLLLGIVPLAVGLFGSVI